MMKKIIFLLSIALIITHSFNLRGQTIHLMIVSDTEDPSIGQSCLVDQNSVYNQFLSISNEINYKLDTVLVNSKLFNYNNVKNALDKIKPDPSDILVFYYSGHGYNFDESKRCSEWPIMHLKTKDAFLGLDEVHEIMKKKNARLTLTLGDLCNEIIDKRVLLPRGLIVEDILPSNKKEIYTNLFTQFKGDILISTSKRGQYSYSDAKNGGFYSFCFVEALNDAANYNSSITWPQLLDDANNRLLILLNDYKITQTPISEKNVQKTDSVILENNVIPNISFLDLNIYFNSIIDNGLKDDVRYKNIKKYTTYFIPKTKVRIYVNKTYTDLMPIEDYLEQLYLNKSKIGRINFIENKSKFNPKLKKYEEIAIQEIWKN